MDTALITYTVTVPSRPDLSRTFTDRGEALAYHSDLLYARRLDSRFATTVPNLCRREGTP